MSMPPESVDVSASIGRPRSPPERQAELLAQGRALRTELDRAVQQTWTDTLDRSQPTLKWLGLGLRQGQALRAWWDRRAAKNGDRSSPPAGPTLASLSVGVAAVILWIRRRRRARAAATAMAAPPAMAAPRLSKALSTLRRVRRALWWWQVGTQLWRWISEPPPLGPRHTRWSSPSAGTDRAPAERRATR